MHRINCTAASAARTKVFSNKTEYIFRDVSVPQTHPQDPGKDDCVGESQNVCLLKGREMFNNLRISKLARVTMVNKQ